MATQRKNISEMSLTKTELNKLCDALQHHEFRAIHAANDIACAPQAAPDRLADPAQARVGCMAAKHVDIRVKFVERKDDE